MANIVFAKYHIDYIIDKIDVKQTSTHNTSPYVGATGSNTNYVSTTGNIISFKSMCLANEQSSMDKGHRINDYKYLAKTYEKKAAALRSSSKSDITGKYIITNFNYEEDSAGNYEITWEFTEIIPFNVTQKTFKIWNKKTSSSNNNKKTSKSNGLNSNLKYLLKTCGTMKKGSKGKCVKSLQTFLQSQGYYKNYKLDGEYQKYTKSAVESLQKKVKLKSNGEWDNSTRTYFQIKYAYPNNIWVSKKYSKN